MIEAIVVTLASKTVLGVLGVLDRRVVLGTAIAGFSVLGIGLLVTSALVSGWWQNALIEMGAGVLFVGLVELALLGALREIIEDQPVAPAEIRITDSAISSRIAELADAIGRIEAKLSTAPPAPPPTV